MGTDRIIRLVKKFLLITVGASLYAVAIASFLDPNSLAPGGISGVAVILNRIISIETGTWIFILNVPIMLLGIWKFGLKFIISTIYCIVLDSAVINFLTPYGPLTEDPLLASLAGASLMAIGIGMVFKGGATTGGTDIIVKVLRIKFPHMRTGNLFLFMDVVVVTASAIVFKNVDRALYAGIAVIVCALVLDIVLYGRDEAKLIFVITDKCEEVTQRLLVELDLGVTHMQGMGAYSGKDKKVIMCAARKPQAPKVEAVVKEEDPLAFMIVSSATEIFGEGYKNFFSERV